jgi:hypothetical protein
MRRDWLFYPKPHRACACYGRKAEFPMQVDRWADAELPFRKAHGVVLRCMLVDCLKTWGHIRQCTLHTATSIRVCVCSSESAAGVSAVGQPFVLNVSIPLACLACL